MYIAYSVLRGQSATAAPYAETTQTEGLNPEQQIRYEAYQDICNKYRREIADIQKYMPGWQPSPPSL